MNSSSNYDPTAAMVSIFFSILMLVGFQIAMGYLSKNIQTKKGYQDSGFWIGFFLGLIGIAYSAGLPDLILRNNIDNLYKKLQLAKPKEPKAEQPKVEEQPKTEEESKLEKQTKTEDKE